MIKKIKILILSGFTFSLTILSVMYTYALIINIWNEPNLLEISHGSNLTSESWNNLLSNFTNLDSRLNAVYNTGTTNTKIGFTRCIINNPVKTKIYNCNGTISSTVPANTDRASVQCPTGMKIITGGGYTSGGVLRENRPSGQYWMMAGGGTFGVIEADCVKVE